MSFFSIVSQKMLTEPVIQLRHTPVLEKNVICRFRCQCPQACIYMPV